MDVDEGMEAIAAQIRVTKPGADVGFVCPQCERKMVGARAFAAQQKAHETQQRGWN
jgi:hypothetical protein